MDEKETEYCGYEFDPEWLENIEDQQSCCVRETLPNTDRCLWHSDSDEKTVEELEESFESSEEALLDGADLSGILGDEIISFEGMGIHESKVNFPADLPSVRLRNANLSDAHLRDANLSDTDLRGSDLSNADLEGANLSDAGLEGADLSEADLLGADLSNAELQDSDLSGANLGKANLSGAKLKDADLSDADLHYADLSGAHLSEVNTTNATFYETDLSGADLCDTDFSKAGLRRADFSKLSIPQDYRKPRDALPSEDWNEVARKYHELVIKCSEDGLVSEARQLKIGEKWARRKEARSDNRYFTALGLWIAGQATGYGVSVSRVLRNMVLLFLGATLVYLSLGIGEGGTGLAVANLFNCTSPFHSCPVPQGELTATVFDKVYYSIVTFTTAPPEEPHGIIVRLVAMAETFLGTLLVVFLGYVLGNREQV